MPNSSVSSVVADATLLPQLWSFHRGGKTLSAYGDTTQVKLKLFFAKSAEIFAAAEAGGPPDMARILAISEEHGIEFVPPLAIG